MWKSDSSMNAIPYGGPNGSSPIVYEPPDNNIINTLYNSLILGKDFYSSSSSSNTNDDDYDDLNLIKSGDIVNYQNLSGPSALTKNDPKDKLKNILFQSTFFIGLGGTEYIYPCFDNHTCTGRAYQSNLVPWEYANFGNNAHWFGMTFAARWSPDGIDIIEVIDNDIM